MPIARPATITNGGFGRRGAGSPGRTASPGHAGPPSRPPRSPTVSGSLEERRTKALGRATEAIARDAGTAASRGKAYAKAILAAATTFIAALFMLGDVDNRVVQSGPMLVVFAIPMLPMLAMILYIPAVVLSDVARLLSVPRGWSDIGIGFLLGAGMGAAMAMTSPDGKSMLTALATTAGGLMGGFAFWRAQGYPGTSRGMAAALDHAYEKVA